MEILAPAGSRESLESAWAAGADAVYLGFSAYSARAGAGNFNEDELRDAIAYAHLRHMRVYVTVNTLVKNAELEGVEKLLRLLSNLRADGILVQDAGILRLIRSRFPELRVHASTQMAIHNAAGVRWCARKGMSRVVLARECSLEEIRLCVREGLEIEVFVHGAQCVAVSGMCLFSGMAGGRSGNRGRCAQPCRMEYRFRGKPGAWLSPRDLCLREDLAALRGAGVASLKIEGRLKRPEYVAVVTDSYRRAADAPEDLSLFPAGVFRPRALSTGYHRAAAGPESRRGQDAARNDAEAERDALRQIFNRGGFMRGYAFGCEDAGVIQPAGVNHQGVGLGIVEDVTGSLARVRVKRTLHDGDGLRFLRPAGEEEKRDREGTDLTYAGREVPLGGIATVRLREGVRVRKGDRVFRLTDAAQLAAAKKMTGKKIPIRLYLRAMPGEALLLRATDGENEAEVSGETVPAAEKRAVTEEELTKNLGRTGKTAFEPTEIRAETGHAFVPASAVNAIRRKALEELEQKRIRAFEKALPPAGKTGAGDSEAEDPAAVARRNACRLTGPDGFPTVTVRTGEQAEAARAMGLRVAWDPEDFRPAMLKKLLGKMEPGDWLRLPEVCEEGTLEMLRSWTETNADRLGGVVIGSLGQLGLSWPVPIGAGDGIPVMNREAAALLREEGCVFATASPELTGEELRELLSTEESGLPILVPVYGRTQLMLLHHCPARTALGLKEGHAACAMCDAGEEGSLRGEALEDRHGYRFPLLRRRLPEGCMVRLMNTLPTDWMDKRIPAIRTVCLTEEDRERTEEILTCLREGRRTAGETTRGHWKRPVE